MMLPVGVVLCIPCQYQVFPPLGVIIAARHRDMLATRHCRHFTGISAHLSSRAWWSSPRFWGGLSIHPKYFLWGCSLVIFQAALFRWCWSAEENQGIPEHGEVWRYRIGSGSYPRNAAWQMALRGFAKCPCRAHWSGISQGAKEAKEAPLLKAPQMCTEPPPAWTL